jgi:predicted nucleotidyltransferase
MIRKNRERELRGILENFYDLPTFHQDNFCIIKRVVQNYFNENVYVYGSFYWGYWDEKSDYDVFIRHRDTKNPKKEIFDVFNDIKSVLKNKHNLNVDIMMIREEIGILIP